MENDPRKRERHASQARYGGFSIPLAGAVGIAAVVLGAGWLMNRSLRQTRAALRQVREGERRYRSLAARLQQLREEESGRLARRVHDDLGQAMTAIRFDLGSVLRRLEGHPDLQERVRGAIVLADQAVRSVRGIALELRPGVLDQLGLAAALEWLGIEFQKRYGVNVANRSDAGTLDASHDRQVALFRIAEEALTNVARHAQATEVALGVRTLPEWIVMEIADNGCGIPPRKLEPPHSLGLFGMQERARLAGAECRILSSPGQGTTVRITLPLNSAAVQGRPARGESN